MSTSQTPRMLAISLTLMLGVLLPCGASATKLAVVTFEKMSNISDFVLVASVLDLAEVDCDAYGECVRIELSVQQFYGAFDALTDYSETVAVAGFDDVAPGDFLVLFGFNCGSDGIGLLFSGSEIFRAELSESFGDVSEKGDLSGSASALSRAIERISHRMRRFDSKDEYRDAACRWLARARVKPAH